MKIADKLRLAQSMGASLERSLNLESVMGKDIFEQGACQLKIVRQWGYFKRAFIEHKDGSTTPVTREQLVELNYEPDIQPRRGLNAKGYYENRAM